MSSYVDSVLTSNEHVVYRTKMSWIVLFWPAFILVITCWTLFALIITVPWLVYEIIVRNGNEYAVTNKRVILKSGIIARKTFEMRLDRVEAITVDQGVTGRLLDFGTVVVSGTGTSSEPFRFLDNPMRFKHEIEEASGK